ncbi:MAG: Crp/Fnr family transcriptional regulator [Bacteroidales bacterium]|jgi:CRP-like cAMP-binding protein|nr:Crp/Fnr family transcriptional regulator [Bacteroidales bacterium]
MYEILSRTRLFKGASPDEIKMLMTDIHFQIRSYDTDDIIAYAGDPMNYLMIVLEGMVMGEISSFEGKSIVVSEIPAPNSFAEAYLFASKKRLKINIKAGAQANILFIHKDFFQRLLSQDAKVLENYLNIISNRFVIVTEKLNFMMIKHVKGRLAYYFLNKPEVTNGLLSFPLGMTHKQLAVFLGITRPALTKNLLEMRDEGIIGIDQKVVSIKDMERLQQLVN